MDRPGIRNDGAASPVPLIIQFAIGTLLVLYALGMSMPAFAQGEFIPRGQPIPESVRWQGSAASHARVMGSFNARMFGLGTYHMVPINYSTSTLGKLVKGAVKRGLPVVGWGLTLKSIIEGAGWVMDELTGQVSVPGEPQEEMTASMWCISNASASQWRCANAPGQLLGALTTHLIATHTSHRLPCGVNGPAPGGGMWYACTRKSDGLYQNLVRDILTSRPTLGWGPDYLNGTGTDPTPVSDAVVGDLVKGNERVVNAIMIDPETGAPIRTPELIDAANALRRQLEAATGTDPATDLDPSTDYSESTPSQTEWPSFCAWAAKLCDWLYDTSPMEENPEVPHQQVEQQFEDYDSGFGGGSCPASSYVSVLDGEFEISWVGICGFVEYLRPLVIGLAWIVAAFAVVGGMRRS